MASINTNKIHLTYPHKAEQQKKNDIKTRGKYSAHTHTHTYTYKKIFHAQWPTNIILEFIQSNFLHIHTRFVMVYTH